MGQRAWCKGINGWYLNGDMITVTPDDTIEVVDIKFWNQVDPPLERAIATMCLFTPEKRLFTLDNSGGVC
ncbi:MAG: hypothetical protein HY878_02245 [Deltaproteobacteria bacterium]|nr:hypothetical protein [Deltaproteobacteria bacterium]